MLQKILEKLGRKCSSLHLDQLYWFIFDITSTKLYSVKSVNASKNAPEYTLLLSFDKIVQKLIQISQNLNHPVLTKILLSNLKNRFNKAMLIHQLSDTNTELQSTSKLNFCWYGSSFFADLA